MDGYTPVGFDCLSIAADGSRALRCVLEATGAPACLCAPGASSAFSAVPLARALRPSRADDGAALVDLWRRAVDATHDFLSPEDRLAIDAEVAGFLPRAPTTVAVDADDRPLGFMLIDGTHLEALFIDPDVRGTGIGRQLLQHALAVHPQLSTDVNAQNAQAVGFYLRMGFIETGRSALDSQGRPYPLIHLRHAG
jgi:putative acetyltransferase